MKLILRLIVNAVALWAAAQVVPGIGFGGDGQQQQLTTVLIVALIFGVVNALIKPIVALATCPFYVLTLGLFTFIVNALMLMLTAWVANRFALPFVVDGFGAAFLGSIVITIVSWLLSLFVGDNDDDERR